MKWINILIAIILLLMIVNSVVFFVNYTKDDGIIYQYEITYWDDTIQYFMSDTKIIDDGNAVRQPKLYYVGGIIIPIEIVKRVEIIAEIHKD